MEMGEKTKEPRVSEMSEEENFVRLVLSSGNS